MLRHWFPACVLALTILASSCASGTSFVDLGARILPVAEGKGRIYVYRTSALGAAVRPGVRLNDEVVGKAIAKGFFFVDRPPGDYRLACSTEAEHHQTLSLGAGEERFVKLVISFGFFVGHVTPELVSEEEGRKDIQSTKYTGDEALLTPAAVP